MAATWRWSGPGFTRDKGPISKSKLESTGRWRSLACRHRLEPHVTAAADEDCEQLFRVVQGLETMRSRQS